GRIQKITIVYSYRAEGCFDPQSQPHAVGHLAEADITHMPEDIAQIVERHQIQSPSYRISQFEVENKERVAAKRDQGRQFVWSAWLQYPLRPCLFEAETP